MVAERWPVPGRILLRSCEDIGLRCLRCRNAKVQFCQAFTARSYDVRPEARQIAGFQGRSAGILIALMTIPRRQSEIVKLARSLGRVTVDDLARRFEVSAQTIRKDLNDLCGNRALTRVHGGAVV